MRHFDASNTDFQSETPGKIIRSIRKFGVEIEMLTKDGTDAIISLSKSISQAFGLENDGSIASDGGEVGIEVVSPIMSGIEGETGIRTLFERINGLGFKVNASCGLHVHLNGEGFRNKSNVKIVKLSELDDTTIKDVTRKDFMFIVKRSLLNELAKHFSEGKNYVAGLLLDEYISTGKKNLYLSKTAGVTVPDIRIRSVVTTIGSINLSLDYYDYTKLFDIVDKKAIIKTESLDASQNDFVCIIKNNNALENTKTLLYVYSVFNDVFMAMLPKSRRNNVYCQDLALSFSPNAIESIKSYTELETQWYKTRDLMETVAHKNNHYDDSRYYGVNLHALFSKYGTVEIRSHSATLQPNKVLYWVSLHQEILDRIVSGKLTIEMLRPGAYIDTLDEKVKFFSSVLNLRTSLRKYIDQRIQHFTDNIK